MGKKTSRHSYQFSIVILIALVSVFVVAWLWLVLEHRGHRQAFYAIKVVGSTFGVIGYVLFSLALFLASRMKVLENWIGGLDQIYRLHHRLGLWGFYFLLAHPLIQSIKWIPQNPKKFFLFIFPFHHSLSVNLGSFAFWLMVIIIVITILKLLPYDRWKLIHKLMALVFVLASLHFLLSRDRLSSGISSLVLLFIPMGLGLFGIIYKQVYMAFFFKSPVYVVTNTSKITDNVVLITLKPEGKPILFTRGQYAFFSFVGEVSREQHPFTICHFQDSSISILAKVRGDFTKALYNTVNAGMRARLEGPYGRFDYTRGGKDQIWIAGGVGIVPFLAWGETLATWPGKVDLFYCIHRKADAVFLDKFDKMKEENINFAFRVFCTEENQRLSVKELQEIEGSLEKKEVFMCGPRRLTHPFVKELVRAGVNRGQIQFEDFEFF